MLIFVLLSTGLTAQMDTSAFEGAIYPTGIEGFYRDLEAFADITLEDKEYLVANPAEIYMEVSAIGTVVYTEVRNPIDSILKLRITEGLYQLHDFIPATYQGVPIESILTIDFTYRRGKDDVPDYIINKDKKMTIDIGGFMGQFAGEINNQLGINGGLAMSYGATLNNTIYAIDFDLFISSSKAEFDWPEGVVKASNKALGLLGLSIGKEIKTLSGQSWRIKAKADYAFLNVGVKEDDSLFRLHGFSPGIEIGYHIPLSQIKHSNSAFATGAYQNGILVYSGFQKLLMDGIQGDGWWYGLGVKYFFSMYGVTLK